MPAKKRAKTDNGSEAEAGAGADALAEALVAAEEAALGGGS